MPREDDTARITLDDGASARRGPTSEGMLTVLRGPNPGALYTIDAAEASIGRSPEAQVSIADDSLSRKHARIRRTPSGFSIEDLGSTNGTFLDGVRVTTAQPLEDGCRIMLGGRTLLRFALHDAVEQAAAHSTHALTVRDPLTRVFNRRHFEERLSSESAYCARHASPLTLLLVDIDRFKLVNDTYGHTTGDSALRLLAHVIGGTMRKEDVLARCGGEEFAIVARGIDERGALAFAERVRSAVELVRLPTEHGELSMTVSIGVAHNEGDSGCDPERMLWSADRALYAAKHAGRNRVELAPPLSAASLRDTLPGDRSN